MTDPSFNGDEVYATCLQTWVEREFPPQRTRRLQTIELASLIAFLLGASASVGPFLHAAMNDTSPVGGPGLILAGVLLLGIGFWAGVWSWGTLSQRKDGPWTGFLTFRATVAGKESETITSGKLYALRVKAVADVQARTGLDADPNWSTDTSRQEKLAGHQTYLVVSAEDYERISVGDCVHAACALQSIGEPLLSLLEADRESSLIKLGERGGQYRVLTWLDA